MEESHNPGLNPFNKAISDLVLSSNLYIRQNNSKTYSSVNACLDAFVEITRSDACLKLFDLKQLVPTECITNLVQIINASEPDLTLADKVFELLVNLCNNRKICEALHNLYNLTSSVAHFLLERVSPEGKVQCTMLLLMLTYNTKIPIEENYVQSLVLFCVKNISGNCQEGGLFQPSILTTYSIGLLANLLRHNEPIKSYVQQLKNIRTLYQPLVKCISNSDAMCISFSMSVFFSLQKIGSKVFNSTNIQETFKVVTDAITSFQGLAVDYAVDLLVDMLKITRLEHSFARHPLLNLFLRNIAERLPKFKLKFLEMLHSLCLLTSIRAQVMAGILALPTNLQVQGNNGRMREQPAAMQLTPLEHIISWPTRYMDSDDSISKWALKLLHEMYKDMLVCPQSAVMLSNVGSIIAMISTILATKYDRNTNKVELITTAIQLLTLLCTENNTRNEAARATDVNTCVALIDSQLDSRATENNSEREAAVAIIIHSMHLMYITKRYHTDMETYLRTLLMDPEIVSYLALGMVSGNSAVVAMTLKLHAIASSIKNFPTDLLSDKISEARRHSGKEDSIKEQHGSMCTHMHIPEMGLSENKENVPFPQQSLNETSASMQSLTGRMARNSVQPQQPKKDELCEVQEHRIHSLEVNESHLQDLLQAKTNALFQSDRLLAQYRCKQVELQAESRKLRGIVRETEKKHEQHLEKQGEQHAEIERLQHNYNKTAQKCSRLTEVAKEYNLLVERSSNQEQQLVMMQVNIQEWTHKHQAQENTNKLLKKDNETMEKDNTDLKKKSREQGERIKNLSQEHKKDERKINELSDQVQQAQDYIVTCDEDKRDMEECISNLREQVNTEKKTIVELQEQDAQQNRVIAEQKEELKNSGTIIGAMRSLINKVPSAES